MLLNLVIMAGKAKRVLVELTLEQKVSLIKDNANGKSQRNLKELYGVSKTTVCNILKRKAEYMDDYENNIAPVRKRTCMRDDSHAKLDKVVFEQFQRNGALNIPISGPLIQEKIMHLY